MRRIATKLLLAALLAVVAPSLVFMLFVRERMKTRLSADVVRHFLKNKASDLADKIDLLVEERNKDLEIWSGHLPAAAALLRPQDEEARERLTEELNRFGIVKEVYDVLLVADREGRVLATNTVDRTGASLSPAWVDSLLGRDVSSFDWFRRALGGELVREDVHVSPLTHPTTTAVPAHPREYGVGFAAPVVEPGTGRVLGVWYSLMSWTFIQEKILDRVKEYFHALGSYESGYAFLWKSDADSIVAHVDRRLYGLHVSSPPISLPLLTQAALREPWGVFPEYEYPPGTWKNSAFKHCAGPAEGGFDWIVGVGINNQDIFRPVRDLASALAGGVVVWLAGILVATGFLARTFTRPLRRLTTFTERVASGDLSGRVEVGTRDEIGGLADSFNRMTAEVAAHREAIVRAEKEAAWREMARQIAHEIKNPLTPMRLSVTLLRRAQREGDPEWPRLLDRSAETILRQIDALERIAGDFKTFAGEPQRNPVRLSVGRVARECLELYSAMSSERDVRVDPPEGDGEIVADPDEVRRLLINLLDNAFEAVGEGGRVAVRIERPSGRVRLLVEDDGPGLSEEVRSRLFEPYFSTKTGGTGLGLAICRRIAHDLGATIALEDRPGGGTRVVVDVPAA